MEPRDERISRQGTRRPRTAGESRLVRARRRGEVRRGGGPRDGDHAGAVNVTAGGELVGVPSEQAFSVAIVYRLITSYIPPILGFFSLNWLKDKGYL